MLASDLIKRICNIQDAHGDINISLVANGKPVNEEYIMFIIVPSPENDKIVKSINMEMHSDLTIIKE